MGYSRFWTCSRSPLDRRLEIEADPRQGEIGRFRAQRVGFAVEFLAQEIEPPADRPAFGQQVPRGRHMPDQPVGLLAHVGARGEIGDLLRQPVLGDRRDGVEQRRDLLADPVADPPGLQRGGGRGLGRQRADPLDMPLQHRPDAAAFRAAGAGKRFERGRQRGRDGVVAGFALGGGLLRLHPFQDSGQRHQRLEPRGRRADPVPPGPVDRRQPLQHRLVHPDVGGLLDLPDRQMEGQRAAAEPLRRRGRAPWARARHAPCGRRTRTSRLRALTLLALPGPARAVLAALGPGETGHALEHGGRFGHSLGNSGRLGLGHVRFALSVAFARRGGSAPSRRGFYSTDRRCRKRIARLASPPGEA